MVRLKVKEIADQKRISQRQLFFRSGVDINTIRKIFRTPTTVVTTETLGKLARGLGVDSSELIEGIADLPDFLSTEDQNE
ncbi:MAG TPA: helix-turn-helix domain-containing protein [Ktedonosporobacter sp.]|nr:helix-turn-helix domain-containing protein [Ktedonosporobacter sp.]